jgi:hypothetical protein
VPATLVSESSCLSRKYVSPLSLGFVKAIGQFPPPELGAFCFSDGSNRPGNYKYCAAVLQPIPPPIVPDLPPCKIFKIKTKTSKFARHGKDTKLDITITNMLKHKQEVKANVTIALPSGVTFVHGKTPSKWVGAPMAMGQNVVVDLGTLRSRRSARLSLIVRLSSSASRMLSFPISIFVPSRNCVDRETIRVGCMTCLMRIRTNQATLTAPFLRGYCLLTARRLQQEVSCMSARQLFWLHDWWLAAWVIFSRDRMTVARSCHST